MLRYIVYPATYQYLYHENYEIRGMVILYRYFMGDMDS